MFVFMLFFTTFFYNAVNKLNNFFIYFMCLEDSFNHLIFRNLIRTSFDHNNLFGCRSNCKCKIRN